MKIKKLIMGFFKTIYELSIETGYYIAYYPKKPDRNKFWIKITSLFLGIIAYLLKFLAFIMPYMLRIIIAACSLLLGFYPTRKYFSLLEDDSPDEALPLKELKSFIDKNYSFDQFVAELFDPFLYYLLQLLDGKK